MKKKVGGQCSYWIVPHVEYVCTNILRRSDFGWWDDDFVVGGDPFVTMVWLLLKQQSAKLLPEARNQPQGTLVIVRSNQTYTMEQWVSVPVSTNDPELVSPSGLLRSGIHGCTRSSLSVPRSESESAVLILTSPSTETEAR